MIVWAHAFVIVWEGIKVAHVSALDPEAVTEGVSMVHDTCTEMGIKIQTQQSTCALHTYIIGGHDQGNHNITHITHSYHRQTLINKMRTWRQ